jgi:hypothetical protein
MEGKYRITLRCAQANFSEVSSCLEKSIKNFGLVKKVEIFLGDPLVFHDYGVNPLADADCRTYARVKSPNGKEIFQIRDIILKTAHRDYELYVKRVLRTIKADMKTAA